MAFFMVNPIFVYDNCRKNLENWDVDDHGAKMTFFMINPILSMTTVGRVWSTGMWMS